MARFGTKVKLWGSLVVVAGGAGLMAKRSWSKFRDKWRYNRKKKALTDKLERVVREKARLEGELDEMDESDRPGTKGGEQPSRGDWEWEGGSSYGKK